MSEDLLHNKRLIGLTPPQVIALLGKPDDQHVMEWDMAYEVSHANIDATMLLIKFDKHNRVVGCEMRETD